MAKSHSGSPRWRNRSLSPTYRSPERHRQRYFQDHYDTEFRGFRKDPRPVHWREESGKFGQNNLRPVPHGNLRPRIYDYSPSPRFRTPPLDNSHRNKFQRNYQPERGEVAQRHSYPPKYPEIAGYREHERPFYQDKVHERHMHEEPRAPRCDKRVKPFNELDPSFSKHEGAWPEGDLRHQRIQTDKYSYSPGRSSEEFVGRSSYQKRYPEDRDFRAHGPASKRARGGTERYDIREPVRDSCWKPDHPLPHHQDKETPRDTATRAFRSSERDFPEPNLISKVAFDYSHKHHRYAGDETVTDGRAPKHPRQEERKYNPAKGPSNTKELDKFDGHRGHEPEKGHQVPPQYSSEKYHSTCPADVCKGDVDLRPLNNNKLKEKVRKQGDSEKTPVSASNQRDKSHKPADLKASSSNASSKTESLMVKVDMKKMVDKYRTAAVGSPSAERQISNDLVAVSRKKEDFHPVFEHLHSAPSDLKREFTQEIITIIHEVKANYFKPSALTLHERFSKMQYEKDANENKAVEKSNPKIHRRIDISLADLKNKRAKRNESGQSGAKVIDDPHDLRHDIERRRKERLRSEDEKVLDADIADRDDQSASLSNLPNRKTEFEKSSRFMRAPFRKFVGKPHSSFSHGENTNACTHKRQFEEDFDHPRTNKRPFKDSFTENRFRINRV
ncbi:BCLAF1 and THRAP3 family member 3 [Microcaecilia unicolor]|uniref:BCLAF1 and THRAP3 family member 3 n=1 Tax=Microcaecilia unicolor TaxID=1415580 RepID=A0A6P7XYZ6_9AMPH|nr:BCLAF1 and THRAP3 family member 3 [Microcaecilia unicolor]